MNQLQQRLSASSSSDKTHCSAAHKVSLLTFEDKTVIIMREAQSDTLRRKVSFEKPAAGDRQQAIRFNYVLPVTRITIFEKYLSVLQNSVRCSDTGNRIMLFYETILRTLHPLPQRATGHQ